VTFNTAAMKLFGYARQEVTGQRMVDLIVPPEFRQAFEEAVTKATSSEPPANRNRHLEMRAVGMDGSAFPIELATVKVELSDGTFFVVHIRDIAERKAHEQERERLLAEAEKANSVKDDLLSNLSHEFRTPLNAILGWSTMLRRGQVPPDRLSHAGEVIERNAQAQSRLVDDLLDASLVAAGLLRLQMSAVDVVSALRAAGDSIRPAAGARGLVVDGPLPVDLGTIHADPARLHHILLNLLSNAIKFSSPGDRITLDAFKDGGMVTIRVADTGVGIAPDFLPFVFERFRQAETSTTRSHGGVGIGLAVVKHLIAVMGGEITAESEGVGKGASFAIRFQAFDDEQLHKPPPPASRLNIS
jgi:PAS domain S-box-containing protein